MSEPTAIASDPERRAPAGVVSTDSETNVPPKLRAVTPARWLRWGGAVLAVALLVALVLLFRFNPSQHTFYPVCVFHRITGWQCPGCGGLRAVHHLLHGDLIMAFRFNPLFVLALPVAAWLGIRRLWRGARATPTSHRAQARWAWTALAILIVFWIVRNLPLEIFKLPAE